MREPLSWEWLAFVARWAGRDDDYFHDLVYERRLDDWYRGGYEGDMPRFQPARSAWHPSNRFYFGIRDDDRDGAETVISRKRLYGNSVVSDPVVVRQQVAKNAKRAKEVRDL